MASFPYDDIGNPQQQQQQQGLVIGNGSTSNAAPTSNDPLNETISSLRKELEAKEEELFGVQATLVAVQAETTHRISQVEKSSQSQVSSLEQQIRRYETEANLAKQEISRMQRKIASLTQEREKALHQAQHDSTDPFQQRTRQSHSRQYPGADPMDMEEDDEPSAVVSPAAVGSTTRKNHDKPQHQQRYLQYQPSFSPSDPAISFPNNSQQSSFSTGHKLIQRLIQILGEKSNLPSKSQPIQHHDTTLMHARMLQSLTLLLTGTQPASALSERDVVQHLLQDLLSQNDASPKSTSVTLEWLQHALVWSPGAAQWMFSIAMTLGDGDQQESLIPAQPSQRRTTLRFSSKKDNSNKSKKISNFYNEWKRHRTAEWTVVEELTAQSTSSLRAALEWIVELAILQIWAWDTDAEHVQYILRCSTLAMNILHMILRACPHTKQSKTAAMGQAGQAGTMAKGLLASMGFAPTVEEGDTGSSCNRLLFIFQRLINLQIQSQLQSTLPPNSTIRGPLKWNHRAARLDDSNLNDYSPELRPENMIPETFLKDHTDNEELVMEWMAIFFQLLRQIWSVADTSELRYHVWLAIPRARFVVATVLDWIQIVLIPREPLQGHLFPREAIRFLGVILCEETISGLFTLPLIQMGAITEPPSTESESNFTYSAVGVLAKTLSAIVQRQYGDREKAKNAAIQFSPNNFERETLRRLNPLRDDIVHFFDILLRLAQSRNRKQQLQDSESANSATDSLGTFADQTEERQDLFVSAAALMLSFPDEDKTHAMKMHGVKKVIKNMLQKQLDELEYLDGK